MRLLRTTILAGLVISSNPGAAAAAPLEYLLDLRAGERVHYEVPIEVVHPGELVIEVGWSGPTLLAFRLDSPGGGIPPFRQSGPSPQRITMDVPGERTGRWTLSVRALPSRYPGEAVVLVASPEPAPDPTLAAAPEEPGPPTPPPAVTPSALRVSRDRRSLFDAVERLRVDMAEVNQELPDGCRWQEPFLSWLGTRLNTSVEGQPPVDDGTRRFMERIARTVAETDALRRTSDPVLHAARPDRPEDRRLWQRLRDERLRPLRASLDRLLSDLSVGHAFELNGQDWARRLVSCLTACERHFEDRTVVGDDEAVSRELARDQWSRILMAAEVLDRLAEAGAGREPSVDASAWQSADR